jgi:hypothetical protein
MNTLTVDLYNRPQSDVAIEKQVRPFLAMALQGSRRLVLSIKPEKRSNPQNRRYWGQGVLAQIAAQSVVNGKQFSAETWHEMFKRMFIGVEELPNGQVIGKSSTKLTKAEFSEFCQQVEAYAATELGVVFFDLPKE